jgi:prevent-host-death family protein
MRTIAAGEFKAKCLALLDEVHDGGEPVLITKRGKPVAQLVRPQAHAAQESPESIFGFMRGMGTITGDIESSEFTDEEWERMFNEKWDRLDQGSSR